MAISSNRAARRAVHHRVSLIPEGTPDPDRCAACASEGTRVHVEAQRYVALVPRYAEEMGLLLQSRRLRVPAGRLRRIPWISGASTLRIVRCRACGAEEVLEEGTGSPEVAPG